MANAWEEYKKKRGISVQQNTVKQEDEDAEGNAWERYKKARGISMENEDWRYRSAEETKRKQEQRQERSALNKQKQYLNDFVGPYTIGGEDAAKANYYGNLLQYGNKYGDVLAQDNGFRGYRQAMANADKAFAAETEKNRKRDEAEDNVREMLSVLPGRSDLTKAERALSAQDRRYARDTALYNQMAQAANQAGSKELRDKASAGYDQANADYGKAFSEYGKAYSASQQEYLNHLQENDRGTYIGMTTTAEETEKTLEELNAKKADLEVKREALYKELQDLQMSGQVSSVDSHGIGHYGKTETQYNSVVAEIAALETELDWYNQSKKYHDKQAGKALYDQYLSGGKVLAPEMVRKAETGKAKYEADRKAAAAKGKETHSYGLNVFAKARGAWRQEKDYLEEAGWDPTFDAASNLRSEDENLFYALYADDPKAAMQFAAYADKLRNEEYEGWMAEWAGESGWNAGAAFFQALGNRIGSGAANLVDPHSATTNQLARTASGLLAGGSQFLNEWSGTIDTDIPIVRDLLNGKGLGDFYQLANSIVESGINAYAAGKLGAFIPGGGAEGVGALGVMLMGSSASAADYNECIKRGLTPGQAQKHALAAGINEALFEFVSMDKLIDTEKLMMASTVGEKIKGMFVQAGVEASEEFCTTVANRLADGAQARRDGYDNSIEYRMKELIALGMDRRQAQEQAEKEWLTELVNDAIGGFISGGGLKLGAYAVTAPARAAVNAAVNSVQNRIATNKTNELKGSSTSAEEAAALRSFAEANGIKVSERVAKETDGNSGRSEDGSDPSLPSPASMGGLDAEGGQQSEASARAAENDETKKSRREIRQERKANRDTGALQTAVVSKLAETVHERGLNSAQEIYTELAQHSKGIARAVQTAVEHEARAVFGQATSQEELNELYRQAVKDVTAQPVRQALKNVYQNATVLRAYQGDSQALRDAMAGPGNGGALKLNAEITGKDGSTQQVRIASLDAERGKVKLDNGETVALNELQGLDADTKDVIEKLDRFDMGDTRALAFHSYLLSEKKGEATDGVRFVMEYALAYDQGRNGVISLEEATKRSSLPTDIVKEAYDQGALQTETWRKDQERQNAEKRAKAKDGATGRKGILDKSRVSQEKLDALSADKKDALRTLELIAEATGVDIRLIAQKADQKGNVRGYQGKYSKDGNYIEIDVNAGLNNIFKDMHTGMTAVLGHELTHWMQENAPTEYLAYKKAVLQAIMSTKNGELTLERMVEAQISQNKREGKEITRSEAEDEVVADASMKRLGDAEFWDAVSENLGDKKADVFAKIKEYISQFFNRVREIIGKASHTSEAAKLIDRVEANVQATLRRLYAEGIGAAMRNSAQTGTETKNAATEGGEGQLSVRQIVGQSGTDYGTGVYLDSTLLEGLTDTERVEMVKERIGELGGQTFTAYDTNGNAVQIRIAQPSQIFRNANGKRVRVNKDLTGKFNRNQVKQEAVVLVDELISASKEGQSEPAKHPHGWLDNNGQNPWVKWTTYIQEKNGNVWLAHLNIATAADGTKHLYDVDPIKIVEQAGTSATSPQQQNAAVNKIAQTQPTVNSQKKNPNSTRDYNSTVILEESTIDKYLRDYAAKTSPNYAQAYIVRMSPDDFLNLTTSKTGRDTIWKQTGDLDVDKLKKATIDQPFQLNIDTKSGQVEGHEGRHRAMALYNNGVKSIPVLLFDSGNKYSKTALDSLDLKGQDFGKTKSNATVTVQDVQPLSYANRDNVVQKFTTQPTTERMGEKYGGKETIRYSTRPTTDSTGRELSEEQQEYFKDSKAVDKDGNLLVLYRGKRGGETVIHGDYRGAIWTTTDPEFADRYGVKDELYANIKNPYYKTVYNTDSDTGYDIDKVIHDAKSGGHDGAIISFMLNPGVATGYVEYAAKNHPNEPASEILKSWTKSSYMDAHEGETIADFWKRANEGPVSQHVVVFSSEQIKRTDNLNPTENPDIRYSTRDYSDSSDLDLLLNAAEEISEGGGEEYWASLLESNPGLANEAEEIKRLGKQLKKTEGELAEARRNLTLTDRKLKTRGIASLAATIMQDQKAGDINKKDVHKRITAVLTEAYQKALDQLDAGADIGTAWETVYSEGVVKAADILLTDATYAEKHGYGWVKTSLSKYLGEGAREYVEADIAARVAQDFETNRYRPGQKATTADRLVAQAENRLNKKLDAAKTENAALKADNAKLSEDKAFFEAQAKSAKETAGDLYQQLLDKREELKNNKKISADERKATLKKLDNMTRQMQAKRKEAQAWKDKAKGETKKLNQAIREKEAAVSKLEKQLQRERDILEGKLKPPAIQKMLAAAREREGKRIAEQKDERFAKYKEKQSAAQLRSRIKNLSDDMKRKMTRPTDGSYVPASLYGAMTQVADLLDTALAPKAGTKAEAKYRAMMDAIHALQNEYEAVKEMDDYTYKSEFDAEILDEIRALEEVLTKDQSWIMRESNDNRALREYSLGDLTRIYDILRTINESMTSAAHFLGKANFQSIWDAMGQIAEQQGDMTSFNRLGWYRKKKRMRMLDSLNVMRATEMMSNWDRNAALYRIMQQVENGVDVSNAWMMEYNKAMQALKTGKNEKAYRDALTKKLDFNVTDEEGLPVQMTKMQALQLLMTAEREAHNDKLVHLQRGGATIRDALAIQDGKKNVASQNIKVTPELINRIQQSLTEWDKAYMKAVRDYFGREGKATNRVLYKLKHRVLQTEDYYVPYAVDKNYLDTNLDETQAMNMWVKTPGSTNALATKASQPVIIDGMDTVMAKHVREIADYIGLAIPIRDFAKVYNGRLKQGEGENPLPVKQTIAKNFGDKGQHLLTQSIIDVQGGSRGASWSTAIAEHLNALQSAFVKSALLINPSVTIKQAASYAAAGSILSHAALDRANHPISVKTDESNAFDPATGLIGHIFFAPNGATAMRIYNEIDKHTSLHYMRRQGMSQAELANEANRSGKWKRAMNSVGASMEQSTAGHIARKVGASLNPVSWIQRMDVATTATLWLACKEQARMDGMKVGTDEYWQHVTELYERVIRETQPMYDSLHRNAGQKSRENSLMQYLFPFRTVPIQNHGQIAASYETLQTALKSKDEARIKEAKKFFAKTMWAQTESAIIFSLMTFLAAALKRKTRKYRDEDEEISLESILQGISSDAAGTMFANLFPLFGSAIWDSAGNIYDSVKTGKKVWSYDAYSVGVVDLMNEFAKAGESLVTDAANMIAGKDVGWDKLSGDIAGMLEKSLKCLGIPASTIKTYTDGFIGNLEDIKEGRIPALNDASWDRSNALNASRYYKAWIAGDEEKLDTVLDDLVKSTGGDEDKLRNAVNTVFKNAYEAGEISLDTYTDFIQNSGLFSDEQEKNKIRDLAKNAFTAEMLTEDEAIDYLTGSGYYDEDEAWKKVMEWEAKAEHEDEEEYSYSQYEDFFDGLDSGMTIRQAGADYLDHGYTEEQLAKAAKDHVKDLYAAGSIDEAEAIRMLKDAGMDSNDAWAKVQEWDYKATHADDESYSKYDPLDEAIRSNKEITSIVADMIAHGADKTNVNKHIKETLVNAYVAGESTEMKLKNQLSRYLGIIGTDANEIVASANKKIRYNKLTASYPNLDISESLANTWYDGTSKTKENGHESAKAAGMSIEAYMKAKAVLDEIKDENGNNTGEDEVIEALAKMNLPSRQKDALYYERYKGTTKYSKKPW